MTKVPRDMHFVPVSGDTGHFSSNMDTDVLKVFVVLVSLLFPASGSVQEDVAAMPRERHLFVQRDKPLPGSPKKLLKIENEQPSRSSGDQNAHDLFRRVRRSLNPDMKPQVTEVRLDSAFCALKFCCKFVQAG